MAGRERSLCQDPIQDLLPHLPQDQGQDQLGRNLGKIPFSW